MRSSSLATSPDATWTISWFMRKKNRSVAGKVSNACDSGETSKTSLLCGAEVCAAFPTSVRSFSTTMVGSEGTHPNVRRCQASEFMYVRIACGAR